MSSESAPGTAVPERAVAAVATVGALVLLAGLGLSARGVATADLPTRLLSADPGTVLVTARGERAARPGAVVPAGAAVRAPAGGTAALDTDGRTVRLGPGAEVVVLDGARQRLRSGSALVDAADGPGLSLRAAGSTVSVRDDAVVRVDAERLLRVASYSGAADVRAPERRRTVLVERLRQLQVGAGGLAGQVAPLALREGDAWEREELPALVEDDLLLQRTVRMLADAPTVVAAALPATEQDDDAEVAAERTLAYALAHDGGSFDLATYLDLQDGRALGGSWGVVAALADADAAGAERFLDRAAGVDGPAPVPVLAAGGADALADEVLGTLPGFVPDAGTPEDAGPAPTARPDGTASPRPDDSPAPRPTRDPVRDVVDTVLDVLPTPLPVPLPTPPSSARPPLVEVEVDVPLVDDAVEGVTGAVDGVVGGGVLGR